MTQVIGYEDFDYVVKRLEKARVCFGSGRERQLLNADPAGLTSRHSRQHLKQELSIAPGMYGVPPQTTALYELMSRPTSVLGTVLGGRTTPILKRLVTSNLLSPDPGTYEIPTTFPSEVKQNVVPFNTKSPREFYKYTDTPGAGQYVLGPYKHRSLQFAHSFGGRKTLIPAVEMKCGPFHFDMCQRCRTYPEGDYWKMNETETRKPQKKQRNTDEVESEGIYLCRDCFEVERRECRLYSKSQIRAFQKVRNCSKVHDHDGCEAKLFLVPQKEIDKTKEREAYLSLYFT